MTAVSTPVPTGTDIAEDIGGKAHGRSMLFDPAGVDAMGVVGTAPAATTLLGRLKAIADAITDMVAKVTASIGLTASADNFKALTASTGTLSPVPKALYIATGGTLIVEGADGQSATFTVPDQCTLGIRPRKFTGGTVSGVIGLY